MNVRASTYETIVLNSLEEAGLRQTVTDIEAAPGGLHMHCRMLMAHRLLCSVVFVKPVCCAVPARSASLKIRSALA